MSKGNPLCAIPDCGRSRHGRNSLCGSHENRKRDYGDPLAGPPIRPRIVETPRIGSCSVDGCDREIFACGMCAAHSVRIRTGVPLDKPIRPRRRRDEPDAVCIVDGCGKLAKGGFGWCKSHWAVLTGKSTEYSARRRSRKFDGPHDNITAADLAAIRAATGTCYLCGEALADPVEFDHVIPLARGGRHLLGNIRAVHRHCNRVKHIALPDEFAQALLGEGVML